MNQYLGSRIKREKRGKKRRKLKAKEVRKIVEKKAKVILQGVQNMFHSTPFYTGF